MPVAHNAHPKITRSFRSTVFFFITRLSLIMSQVLYQII